MDFEIFASAERLDEVPANEAGRAANQDFVAWHDGWSLKLVIAYQGSPVLIGFSYMTILQRLKRSVPPSFQNAAQLEHLASEYFRQGKFSAAYDVFTIYLRRTQRQHLISTKEPGPITSELDDRTIRDFLDERMEMWRNGNLPIDAS